MARDCWQYHYSVNFIENPIVSPCSTAEATIRDYYDQHWYMDSRASSHVIGQKESLELLYDNYSNQRISTANGASHPISRIGSTSVSFATNIINLVRILYVYALYQNLIFIGSLADD